MSLLDEVRNAPIVADVVVLNPEVRDALVELADAATMFADELEGCSCHIHRHESAFRAALERLQR